MCSLSSESRLIMIPDGITGSYNEDYNIAYVDSIIRAKLKQERQDIAILQDKHQKLAAIVQQPQNFLTRQKTLAEMHKLQNEISQIASGAKQQTYEARVAPLLQAYRKYAGKIKTVVFDMEEEEPCIDENVRQRLLVIDSFLDIAAEYININVVRVNRCIGNVCLGCGTSLAKVVPNDSGSLRCPNGDCLTERSVVIKSKLSKDSSRINTNNSTEDESIDNFMRAFIRYQGLQVDHPDDQLYCDLDVYFARHGLPLGKDVRSLPLNERGRRGDTNHKMLWTALATIGYASYEDANLIGHVYWGWTLPDVMQYRDIIIQHYNKTQKVFHQIPAEERYRNSSLGTQYRLWRHLQLVGHDCYIDEFRIAENPDSIRTHNRLWRLMCEGAHDPNIYYIP